MNEEGTLDSNYPPTQHLEGYAAAHIGDGDNPNCTKVARKRMQILGEG